MDLRSIANQVSEVVNPNLTVTLQASTGFTVGAGLKQVPTYATPVAGPAQIQALDNSDLTHIEGLNIQGSIRAIYLRGNLAAVIRPDSEGGDIITIASPAPTPYIGTWLVVKIIETWPLWAKALIVLQGAS